MKIRNIYMKNLKIKNECEYDDNFFDIYNEDN